MTPHRIDTSRYRRRSRASLGAWVIALGSALHVLAVTGAGHPGSPPVTDPAGWPMWWRERGPIDAVAGIGRLVAIALVVYLLAVTLLQIAVVGIASVRTRSRTRALPTGRAGRAVRRLGPRFLAGLTVSAVLAGPGLAGPGLAGATGGADRPDPTGGAPGATPGSGATMEVLADGPGAPSTTSTTSTTGSVPHTSLPWGDPGRSDGPVAAPERTTNPTVPSVPTAPPSREVVARPGDHLWSIARREQETRLGRTPTTAEIQPYWQMVVDVNRDRLAQPDDADLIFPGQTFVLP